jgi:dGTPase
MYSDDDKIREKTENVSDTDYRTVWRQDYARLIHCPSFRRLQGKTQLFPASETDFFRNRLTHSLEVAQIAKSIALKINKAYKVEIDLDLVEFAALAHDLGHPPFGHQGEEALDECMVDYGGYEGNAQTLRILSKIEKKNNNGFLDENQYDNRVGLNLCYRTLASILKYNEVIPLRKDSREQRRIEKNQSSIRPVKEIYKSEENLVKKIKKGVTGGKAFNPSIFKTIECQIMDIADDISNSTYDLEDVLKAGFFTPYDFLYATNDLIDKIRDDIANDKDVKHELEAADKTLTSEAIRAVLKNIFGKVLELEVPDFIPETNEEMQDYFEYVNKLSYQASNEIVENGYNRVELTSGLINDFISGVEFKIDRNIPALSKVKLKLETRIQVEILKRFTYQVQILSPKLKIAEFRGKDIVKKVFEALNGPNGHELLPKDYRELYHEAKDDRKRIICDFIAGMTDKYLIEFYGRLTSERPETIFKPI